MTRLYSVSRITTVYEQTLSGAKAVLRYPTLHHDVTHGRARERRWLRTPHKVASAPRAGVPGILLVATLFLQT